MPITPFVPPSFLSSLPTGIWSGVDGLPVLPFLPGQAVGVTKSPQWSTKVILSASGRRRATAFWSYPLWAFELQYEVVRHRPNQGELFTLWEFFNVAQGQRGVWLFVDPSDCQIASGSPVQFAIGDGTTTSFQLSRSINSFTEPVFAAYAPTILDNGAAAGAHTVANGAVTFSTPPAGGHALSWYGYFYFGCAFGEDGLTFEQIVSQLWSSKSLKFSSIRV
jgi:uncharacterized protein (TIGR02217 family)